MTVPYHSPGTVYAIENMWNFTKYIHSNPTGTSDSTYGIGMGLSHIIPPPDHMAGLPELSQVEILLRSCKILQESCKILIKIKILIRSCLTFKILKNLSKNLVRS